MKVICKSNTGQAFQSYKMPVGFFETSQFAIQIGKEYLVLAILLGEGLLTYLIDDFGIPQLCPFQLFEVVDPAVNVNWIFRAYTSKDNLYPYRQAIWGYKELCNDDYLDSLLEQQEEALITYFKKKIELENELRLENNLS